MTEAHTAAVPADGEPRSRRAPAAGRSRHGNLAAGLLAGTLAYPLDAADLSGAGPVQALRRLARRRKTADFEAAMAFLDGLGIINVGWQVSRAPGEALPGAATGCRRDNIGV